MSLLKAFLKFINAVNDKVGYLLSYFLFFFFALLFLEVILRYFFNSPTVWANELAQMFFGAYAILAGGYILRSGGHVNVDILYSRLPKKSRAASVRCHSLGLGQAVSKEAPLTINARTGYGFPSSTA